MLSEAKKQFSWNCWHWVQHSACVGVTTAKLWMGHHYDFYYHNTKRPDSLERSLEDVNSPVVRSQVSMVNTPGTGIIWQNKSMLVATDQGAAPHPNGLLTHSDPT